MTENIPENPSMRNQKIALAKDLISKGVGPADARKRIKAEFNESIDMTLLSQMFRAMSPKIFNTTDATVIQKVFTAALDIPAFLELMNAFPEIGNAMEKLEKMIKNDRIV